jgi:ferredoxin
MTPSKKSGAQKNTAKRSEKRPQTPNIDYGLCQGCGGCAEAYPRLFEMREEKAWVINADSFDPERDKGILTVCPYYAITIDTL